MPDCTRCGDLLPCRPPPSAVRLPLMSQPVRSKRGRQARLPAGGAPRPAWPPAALALVAAALVLLLALWQAARTWRELPVAQLRHLDSQRIRQMFEQARRQMAGEARSGWIQNIVSAHLVTALRDPSAWQGLWDDAVAGAGQIRNSQLPQLQLAVLKLVQLRQTQATASERWPQVAPLLADIDPSALQHYVLPLTQFYAARYRELGPRPGTALLLGRSAVGFTHGPFLELLSQELVRLADALRQAQQPEAAGQCDRVRRRLLKQWVLQPGPPELRLLAAELLAEDRAAAAKNGDPPAGALADDLCAWRVAYRTSALAALPTSPVLGWPELPVRDSWARTHLPVWVSQMANLAAASLTAGVVLLASGWSLIRHRPRWNRAFVVRLSGLAVVLTALVALLGHAVPATAVDDLRRLSSGDLGWPRLVTAAAVGALVLPALLGGLLPHVLGGRRWTAVALLAAALVIVAGLALAGTSIRVRAGLARYEAGLAQDGPDSYTAIAGPQADALLHRLRAWNPP